MAIAFKTTENLIAGASVTAYTDCRGLMLLAKHAVSNGKMRRYLEFLQSFEPPIKLRWQSSKDPSFKIVDYLSRPNTVGDPPILNKNIPGNIEEDIELRCEKLSTAKNTVDNYILLMDFLLEQPDSSVEKLDNCSVYIDGAVLRIAQY